MKTTSKRLLSMMLSLAMVIPAFAFGSIPAVAVSPDAQGTEKVQPVDDSTTIENSDSLVNGVQAYYKNASKQFYVGENQQMYFEYSLREKGNMQISSLTDKEGNVYIANTLDAFVTLNGGMRNYASNSTYDPKANLHRLGYYYYDMRIEGQNFISDYHVVSEKSIYLSAKLNTNDVSLTNRYGTIAGKITSSNDPFIPLTISSNNKFSADKYQYIKITMATDSSITGAGFFYSTDSDSGFNESRRVDFSVKGNGVNGDQIVYMVPMFTDSDYKGTVDELRLDFNGATEAQFKITKLEVVEVDNGDYPQGLQVVRDFLIYSDKMHSFTQFTATEEVNNISEIGIEVKIPVDNVREYAIKADGRTYDDLLDVDDWSSSEYAGFVIDGTGVFGYIMPADNSGGTLTVTEEEGYYVIRQTLTPENGTIIPSTEKMTDENGKADPNGNDIFIGQRIYTDSETTLGKFLVEAELERNPIPAENITVSGESDGYYWGYDAIRGAYKFNIEGFGGFSEQYFTAQNRHFKLDFAIEGDGKDRDIYVLAYCSHGMLECAALLDANEMLIPVPLQVGKNFSEAHGERNKFNLDDPTYSETIFPMTVEANSKYEYTLLNLYQNWGQTALKQISWIQYTAPYYHLSTGATETNCIVPIADNGPNLPDHRPMSAPLWVDQPQHNNCGSHKFLTYTDASNTVVKSMNTTDCITSYGPTYAEIDMNFVTSDGKIKATYTHMEMPQTDENRTYYTLKYEVLEDVTIDDFKNDFQFYSVGSNDPTGTYQRVGYLNTNNQSAVAKAQKSGSTASYVLGNECPYFSYYDMDGASSEHNKNAAGEKGKGYSNVAFLIYNSQFTIGGESATPNFIINDLGGKISISLNLDDVTLKKGDTFTINAILLPWGSQEMEDLYDTIEDKNVRDVRANTLLDPVTATPVADPMVNGASVTAEVVDSAFLPRVKTTNGSEAVFTLSGGENNQAVRVDGFNMLTDPKIYEFKDGIWRAYNVCSALTPDVNGEGHAYDGYTVFYDADTKTYSYAFIVDMTGDVERTFKVVANEEFDGWEISVADTQAASSDMNMIFDAESVLKSAKNGTGLSNVELLTEDFDFVRMTSKPDLPSGKQEGYFYLFANENQENITGNYIVMKYRTPGKITSWIEFYTASTTKNAGGSSYPMAANLVDVDDSWHILVVDIKAYNRNLERCKYDEFGRFVAKHLRFDLFHGITDTQYFDIAYIGMADSLSEIFEYEETLTEAYVFSGESKKTIVKESQLNLAEISVGSTVVNNGDLFAIPVYIKNNNGFSYLNLATIYDKDLFTFMGYIQGDVNDSFNLEGSRFVWTDKNPYAKDGTLVTLLFKAKNTMPEDVKYDITVKVADANKIDGTGFDTKVVNGGTVTFKTFTYGKVTEDGKDRVTSMDVSVLREYLSNLDAETGISTVEVLQGADANCDGKIDLQDLVLLRKYLANYNFETGESTYIIGPQIRTGSME